MKHVFILFSLILASGCAMLNPTSSIEKTMTAATAQRWSGGAPGSGRGVIFTLKFYQLADELDADTLFVNDIPLLTSMSQVGDTTYIISSFDTQHGEARTLANDPTYQGILKFRVGDKKDALPIKEFKVLPPMNYP
jgi:hypothetical protein